MKRGYTIERFIDIINSLKKIKPEIGLITDLIVGFPGETDQDFEDTISLVKTVQFDSVFAFKFSPRQGTPAASMPDQVPQMVKEERLARLQAVINEVATRRYSAMVGKSVEVLVEGPSRKNPSRLEGRTRCNKIVVFDPAHHQPGQIVNLKITHATATTLYSISENLTPKHQNIKLLNVT
jgi:tRNA-2-methylthio-N6-dimethylallyladenosine synthase